MKNLYPVTDDNVTEVKDGVTIIRADLVRLLEAAIDGVENADTTTAASNAAKHVGDALLAAASFAVALKWQRTVEAALDNGRGQDFVTAQLTEFMVGNAKSLAQTAVQAGPLAHLFRSFMIQSAAQTIDAITDEAVKDRIFRDLKQDEVNAAVFGADFGKDAGTVFNLGGASIGDGDTLSIVRDAVSRFGLDPDTVRPVPGCPGAYEVSASRPSETN